jgi:hypothetical protein
LQSSTAIVVAVDAVEAAPHHTAEAVPLGLGGGLLLVEERPSVRLRDAAPGGDEEVPRAARGVADLDRLDGSDRVGLGERASEHGVERGVEEALHQHGRGVVRARRLALVAGDGEEHEVGVEVALGAAQHVGLKLHQPLVDAAQLVGPDGRPVHGHAPLALVHRAQRVERGQQVLVANLAGVEVREGLGPPEEAVERGEREAGVAVLQRSHHEPDVRPAVGVGAAPAALLGEAAEARGAVPVFVEIAGRLGGLRVEEEAAVFGDKEEDQAVHEPEQLAVVALAVERAGAEGLVQGGVAGHREEAPAEGGERADDPVAEPVERVDALLAGALLPALDPGVLVGDALEAAGVREEPEGGEVVEPLAVEDVLEVEADVGRAAERAVVAQQPQLAAVGDDRPEVLRRAVEGVLHEAVRRGGGGASLPGGAGVEAGVPPEEVDQNARRPGVGDRVGLAVEVERPGGLRGAEAELLEQGEQEGVAGEGGAGVVLRETVDALPEVLPGAEEAGPARGDAVVNLLAGPEVIVSGRGAFERVAAREPLEEGGDEEHPVAAHRREGVVWGRCHRASVLVAVA